MDNWIDTHYRNKPGTIHFEDKAMAKFLARDYLGTPLAVKKVVLGNFVRTFYPVRFPDLAKAYHAERDLIKTML